MDTGSVPALEICAEVWILSRTFTAPKFTEAGTKEICCDGRSPIAISGTVSGLPEALYPTSISAIRAPGADGEKLT